MRTLVTRLLCFLLVWTSTVPAYGMAPVAPPAADEATLLAAYPHARILHVTAEEYPALAATLAQQGYQPGDTPLQLARQGGVAVSGGVSTRGVSSDYQDECGEPRQGRDTTDASIGLHFDTMGGHHGGHGRDDAVLFVIIGAVVVVVWTFYALKYLYDVSIGIAPCDPWSEMSAASHFAWGDVNQSAQFHGARFLTGFRDGGTDIGLIAELGQVDIRLTEIDTLRLQGGYWLIGPILRWRLSHARNPDYFQMEFIAGSSEHREVGLLAQAKAGISVGFPGGLRLGFDVGAMQLDLNDTQGIITQRHQYHSLVGLELGYRF